MSRLKKNLGRRLLAFILSGAMIMSNMTAFASEPLNNTGGGYYEESADETEGTAAEERADHTDSDDADEAEENEKAEDVKDADKAEETEKAEDAKSTEDADKADNAETVENAETAGAAEDGTETAKAAEENTEGNDQASETESSLSAENEETESTETETEKTEEVSEENVTEVSKTDDDVKADATIDGWTSIGAVAVESEKQADGSVVLKSAVTSQMGKDNTKTSVLAFGEATNKNITIVAKIKVNTAAASNNGGIGIGVAKKDDLKTSTYVAYRKDNVSSISYVNKVASGASEATDQYASSSLIASATVETDYNMEVIKADNKITINITGGGTASKTYTIGTVGNTLITAADELYPVIFIDGCTATISELTVTVDGTKVYDMAEGGGSTGGDNVKIETKTWSFPYGTFDADLNTNPANNLEHDGLIIDGFKTENNKPHITAGNGGTVKIPMPRSGVIKLQLYYRADGYVGEDSTKNKFSHNNNSRIYPEYYYISSGNENETVTIHTTGTTYIEKIDVTYTGRIDISGTASVSENGTIPSDLKAVFTNSESGDKVECPLASGEFTGQLMKGWKYDVTMSDPSYLIASASNKSFQKDDETGKWSVTPSGNLADVALTLDHTVTVNVSGKITGLEGSAINDLKLSFINDEKNYKPSDTIDINKTADSDGNYAYKAVLQQGVEYEVTAEGVDEYELQTTTISASADSTNKDIVFEKKNTIDVTIKAVLKDDESQTDILSDIKQTGAKITFTDIKTEKPYEFTDWDAIALIPGTYGIKVSDCAPYTQRPTSNLTIEGTETESVEKVVKFSAEPRTSWNFRKKTDQGGLLDSSLNVIQGANSEITTLWGLRIDATNGEQAGGKFDPTGNSADWAQTNNMTIDIPVAGPCDVTVVGYNAGFTLNGEKATETTLVYKYRDNGSGTVQYKVEGNNYIGSINIVYVHDYQPTITVGKNKDYATINDALDAAKKMDRTSEQRVTIAIDPGDYEEMLVIDTPNITLKNASATPSIKLKNKGVDIDANAVRITSYYGHGYTYYSMGNDSKYDEELLAVNKENGYASFENYGAGTKVGQYWNATVVVSKSGFTAEGIIFENSFNQYVSKKAAQDRIEPQEPCENNQNAGAKENKDAPRAEMQAGDTKVQEKEYVERAAAFAITNNCQQISFDNCKIVGRQDTLYGGSNVTAAFYNCDILGNTDFICGPMTAVFAKCNLLINTTTHNNDIAYVAVPQTKDSARGYLLYNCTIDYAKAGEDNATEVDAANNKFRKQAYLGRPWVDTKNGASKPEAVFYKTILEKDDKGKSIIVSEGWKPWSSSGTAYYSENMQEYGTIELVKGIDNSGWRADWASVLSLNENDKVALADGTEVDDDTVISTFLGDWDAFADKDLTIVEPEKKYEEPDKTFMIALNANDLEVGTWAQGHQVGDFYINASEGHEVSVDALKNAETGDDAHVKIDNYAFSKRLKLGANGTKDYRSISFDTTGYGSGYLRVIAKSASSTEERDLAVWKDGESAPAVTKAVSNERVDVYQFPLSEEGQYYLAATGESVNIFHVAFYAGTVEEPTPPGEGEELVSEVLDASGLDDGDITANKTVGMFTIMADSSNKMTVDANSKKYDDDNLTFTKRLKMNGKGSASSRSIKFTIPQITGTGKVTVYAMSGTGSEERGLTLYKADGTAVGEEQMYGGSTPTKHVYEFTEAGEYYITNTTTACNIYYVKLEYTGTKPGTENPNPPDEPEPDKPKEEQTHTLWLVGDSTVSAFNDAYYYPRYGYGTQIENYETGYYKVENLAMSGRSSKSYLTDKDSKPLYEKLKAGISAGDVLIIGFGHNDEKQGESDRYTNPNGDYTTEGSFAKSLYDNYVKIAVDAGATPILCTPIVRRNASGALTDKECHIIGDVEGYPGGDYPKAIRNLGAAVGVTVVDLTAQTKELYTTLGAAGTLKLHAWTSDQPGNVDNTHLNIYGAKKVAYMLAKEIQAKNIEGVSEHFWTEVEPTEAKDLKPNPDYVPPTYSNDLKQSEHWKDFGVFKGTVFGTVDSDMSFYSVGADEDGSMRLKALEEKSKIASKEDGLAMYYYKVPVGTDFSISAKAKINSIGTGAKANQVAFGLMARDDMYIDSVKGVDVSAIASDFVAAGSLGNSDGTWTNGFKRKSGKLEKGSTLADGKIAVGGTYDLNITSNPDGYAVTFDTEGTQTGGFDYPLTAVDSEYVYIGMFVSRIADVTFTDIKLTVGGKEIDINGSGEENPTPGPENPTPGPENPTPDDPINPIDPDKPAADVDLADTTVITVRVPNVLSNGKAERQDSEPIVTWKHEEDGKTVDRKLVEGYHYTIADKAGSDYTTVDKEQTYVIKAVSGSGFTGEVEAAYKIYDKKSTDVKLVSKLKVTLGTKAFDYTGAAISFSDITVADGSTTLKEGTDYNIVFKNNYNAGKGTVIVVGSGIPNAAGVSYIGSKEVDFTIKKVNIKNLTPSYDKEYKYFGKAVAVKNLKIKLDAYTLVEGRDYTVSYKANDKPGTASFTIKAKGDNFTGSISKQTFTIGEIKLSDIPEDALKTIEYSPKGAKLSVISFNDPDGNEVTLKEGKDYKAKYSGKAKDIGDTVTATITGKNVDKGATREASLTVAAADFSKVSAASESDLMLDMKKLAKKDSLIKITDYAGAKLKLSKDYTLVWDAADKGSAATGLVLTIKPSDTKLYTGEKVVEYRVANKLAAKDYNGKVSDKYFNGRTPVTITAGDIDGLEAGDFRVVSYKNNAKAGKAGKPVKATVTIEGTGKYYGKITLKFNVYN